MRIVIKTLVEQAPSSVIEGFTRELFLKLNPPFPPVVLKEFGGCKKGDKVVLELNFIFFKQTWISDITDDQATNDEIYFVDEGIKLPFFLKTWKHRHRLVNRANQTLIIDDIQFTTPTLLTNYLLYPALYLQFLYRKPIYKRIFKLKQQSVS